MYNQYVTWKKEPLAAGQSWQCKMSQIQDVFLMYLGAVTAAASLLWKGNVLNVS